MTPFVKQLLSRALAFCTRWHHRATTYDESVAEHHSFCSRIAYEIALLLRHEDDYVLDVDQYRVAIAALYHDEPELITGDIPASLKDGIPRAREAVDEWERIVTTDLWEHYPEFLRTELQSIVTGTQLSAIEHEIVKYADSLSAYAFVLDQVATGNSYMQDLLPKFDVYFSKLNWPWLLMLRRLYDLP